MKTVVKVNVSLCYFDEGSGRDDFKNDGVVGMITKWWRWVVSVMRNKGWWWVLRGIINKSSLEACTNISAIFAKMSYE